MAWPREILRGCCKEKDSSWRNPWAHELGQLPGNQIWGLSHLQPETDLEKSAESCKNLDSWFPEICRAGYEHVHVDGKTGDSHVTPRLRRPNLDFEKNPLQPEMKGMLSSLLSVKQIAHISLNTGTVVAAASRIPTSLPFFSLWINSWRIWHQFNCDDCF